MLQVRHALPIEASALSELCFHSKSHWGYGPAFMEACREELSLSSEEIKADHVFVGLRETEIVGVAHLKSISSKRRDLYELEKLFVDPQSLGQGVGRLLFDAVIQRLHEVNLVGSALKPLKIVSDPFAKEFYLKMGAYEAGYELSKTWPDRQLPVLFYDLC